MEELALPHPRRSGPAQLTRPAPQIKVSLNNDLQDSLSFFVLWTSLVCPKQGSPAAEFSAFTPTDGLVFTRINNDTEYSVDKGTVSNTATAIGVPTYYEGKEVTTLGASAFDLFSQLVSIQLPDGLKTIGTWAFEDCGSLTLTSLSDGVTSIGQYAFYGCSRLALTSLPDGVKSIAERAFQDCTKLTEITINSPTPPTAGTTIFEGCTNLKKIKAPSANVDDYKTASGGDTYSNLIESI